MGIDNMFSMYLNDKKFCSERVTIAERQGTSENENYEGKSTQLKNPILHVVSV